jgi:hypothetical protein
MSKRFKIAFTAGAWLLIVFNTLFVLSEPSAKVGLSFTRRTGFPFPTRIENVRFIASVPAGQPTPVVTTIKDEQWLWAVNIGVWFLLCYRFARWVDRNGAEWWNVEARKSGVLTRVLTACGGIAGRAYRWVHPRPRGVSPPPR